MELHTISATVREPEGKGGAHRLRADGTIPAVVYGDGSVAHLAIAPDALVLLRRSPLGWNQPVRLAVEGGSDIELAMLKDIQRHPVSRAVLHADFLALRDSSVVTVTVPLNIFGKSKGVAVGGKLTQTLREAKIACTPGKIPAQLDVDITEVDVGGKLMLSQIPLPDGCQPAWKQDATIVSIARGRVAAPKPGKDDGKKKK